MFKQLQRNYIYLLAAVLLAAIFCLPIQGAQEQTGWILYTNSVGFNPSQDYWVLLSADTGIFNSTENRLLFEIWMTSYLVFVQNTTLNFTVSFNGLSPVSVKGDQGNDFRVVSNNTQIHVNPGDMVTVYWSMQRSPWVPLEFIIGIAGFCLCIGGPYVGIRNIQKGRIQDGFIITLIFTTLGICFVLAWLWG